MSRSGLGRRRDGRGARRERDLVASLREVEGEKPGREDTEGEQRELGPPYLAAESQAERTPVGGRAPQAFEVGGDLVDAGARQGIGREWVGHVCPNQRVL